MEICRNGRVHLIDFYGRDCVCGVFSDSENIADSKDSQRPFAVHLFNVAAFDDERSVYLAQIPHEGHQPQPG